MVETVKERKSKMFEGFKLSEKLIADLREDFRRGPILENEKRLLLEGKFPEKIGDRLTVSVFPKECEPAHFRVDYQGQNARFDLETGEPIDELPREIKKYKKNIEKWFLKNKKEIQSFYMKNRPDDASPTSKLKSFSVVE